MTARLSSRIEALEKRLESLEKPEPYLVLSANSQEERDTLTQQNPGRKIIFFVVVCGRKDCDTCKDRGGFNCRHKEPTP
jgi:hypothetical protein